MSDRPPKPLTFEAFRRWAVWSADRFPTSEAAMRARLKRKLARSTPQQAGGGEPNPTLWVPTVLAMLKDGQRLDDAAVASAMISAMQRKGLPHKAIEARLRLKGISAPEARAAVSRAIDSDSAQEADLLAAQRYLQRRRLGPYRRPITTSGSGLDCGGNAAPDRRALRALLRAGFDLETANQALRQTSEDS